MSTSFFICPVCGGTLEGARTLRCAKGHTYDFSKYGYVNLLMSNQNSGKRHGDDKRMVQSRSAFLDKGWYAPVRQTILDVLSRHAQPGMRILDAGCGECWYTAHFASQLADFSPKIAGVDISKDALRYGAKRGGVELAVASTAKLPISADSCDVVLNIFSPPELVEFHRVLKPGGLLIRALPMERHLWTLKSAVYDVPYPNPAPVTELEGFTLLDRRDVCYKMALPCQEDIWNLFTMTPYYYKTGRADQEKLQTLEQLDETVEIVVLAYEAT